MRPSGSQSMENGIGSRHAKYDLTLAGEIDSNDLLHTPVAEPQTILVPTRRLSEPETGQQGDGITTSSWRPTCSATYNDA